MIKKWLLGLFFTPWLFTFYLIEDSGPTPVPPFIHALLGAFNNQNHKKETDLAKLYLKKGANPNTTGWYGTPLHIASFNNNSELIEALLSQGTLINRQECEEGKTPAITAAEHGNKEALITLIKHGADISIRAKSGKTATDFAKDDEIRDILRGWSEAQNEKK